MRLFLDDLRPSLPGFVRVRTAGEAIDVLKTDRVSVVSFDHDLGEGKTGLDVVNAIEEDIVTGALDLPIMLCHSSNAPGRANIERAIAAINSRAWETPFPGWGFLARAARRHFAALGQRLVARAFGSQPGLFVEGRNTPICIEIKGGVLNAPLKIGAGLARLAHREAEGGCQGILVVPDTRAATEQLVDAGFSRLLVDANGNARAKDFKG